VADPVVGVGGLVKRYDEVCAVDDLDLDVAAGEIVGLVGPNGAGKTTLLSVLCGILEPTAGRVRIAGHALDEDDGVPLRRQVAFVPDTPHLFESLTVVEHLTFVAELYGARARAAASMDGLLREFELADKRDELTANLSRGMRQKVAICCAFVHEPRALLLDEPLTGLDPLGRRRMIEAIRRRADEGAAVLVSSHQLEIVERLSDRFVILQRGRVRLDGTLDEIRRAAASDGLSLEDVFLHATDVTSERDAPRAGGDREAGPDGTRPGDAA